MDQWQPSTQKLVKEWKAKKVPAHMHVGDTPVAPLSGETWPADVPPYWLEGDTLFSDHVASQQMHMIKFNGKSSTYYAIGVPLTSIIGARQLKGQPDVTEEQWERAMEADLQKHDGNQTSPNKSPGIIGGILGRTRNVFEFVTSTFTGGSAPSSPEKRPGSIDKTFWERHNDQRKLPEPDVKTRQLGEELLLPNKKVPQKKRKASDDTNNVSRNHEKRPRRD
jgi:hypothetical protein